MKSRLPFWLIILALMLSGTWAGWLGQFQLFAKASILDRAESVLLDLRILLTGQRKPPDFIVIVAIDDKTVAASGGKMNDRVFLAQLVKKIADLGAQSLAVDMLLTGGTDEAGDKKLAEAMAAIPTVIAGAGQFGQNSRTDAFVPATIEELMPVPALAEVASVGFVNISTDPNGTPRFAPLLFETSDGLEPSFVLRAVIDYLNDAPMLIQEGLVIDKHLTPLDLGWHLPFNYYGPRGSIQTVSAQDVIEGSMNGVSLQNSLVVLGVTATGIGDRFNTPFDQILPGAEVLATGIANILDSSVLIRDPQIRQADLTAALAITAIGMLCVAFMPLSMASIIYLSCLSGWLSAITILFGYGFWFNGALSVAASLPPVIIMIILRQNFDRRQLQMATVAKDELSRFQAPALAAKIAEDPQFLRKPRELNATILFVDLSGYTGLSERLGPALARDFLKNFHTLLVDECRTNNGLVMDFMGDGAMVAFGVPDPGTKDCSDACACAFALVKGIRTWIASAGLATEIDEVRVGVHHGLVMLSRLGHENHQQIAVTGDCVNVASRLIEVAKAEKAAIVTSTLVFDTALNTTPNLLPPSRTETTAIRGRSQSLQISVWTTSDILASG